MKKILLNKGIFTIVDDEDFAYLSKKKWHIETGQNGKFKYARHNFYIKGKRSYGCIKMHRLVIGAKKGQHVDHINGDMLDNRKENLRFCTNQQNQMNGKPRRGRKYKGCYKDKFGKWRAQIRKDYKLHHLGSFKTMKEAAKAYDNAAKNLFGEFAHLNFP